MSHLLGCDDLVNDLLDQFARTEITDIEFLRRMKDLKDIAKLRAERIVYGPALVGERDEQVAESIDEHESLGFGA